MSKRKTTEEFIIDAEKIHHSRYDYSLVDYKGAKTKVIIICREHIYEFKMYPSNHLNNQGCPKCGGVYKKNTEEFIIDAKKVHGDSYDYSLIDYKNSKMKVKIICKEHGEFSQVSSTHLCGKGCPKCAGFDYNMSDFLSDSKKIHGDLYNYDKVLFKNKTSKVDIICKKHGIFSQKVVKHISNQGCPKCSNNVRLTTNEFIEVSNVVHNNIYGYKNVNYINNQTKVVIICEKHGIFHQRPLNHMYKAKGCPKCNRSKGEARIKKYLNAENIENREQETFEGCVYKAKLKFDFYLPKYNMCIEYDGEFHFHTYEFIGGDVALKDSQKKDNIKTEYCKDNNIKLLRIPYWDFKSIEDILDIEITSLKSKKKTII